MLSTAPFNFHSNFYTSELGDEGDEFTLMETTF